MPLSKQPSISARRFLESAGEEERLSRRAVADIVDFVSRRQSLESL
jgi:hypothetical protein